MSLLISGGPSATYVANLITHNYTFFASTIAGLIDNNQSIFTTSIVNLITNNDAEFTTCLVNLIENNSVEFATCLANLIENNSVQSANVVTYLIDNNQSLFTTSIVNLITNNNAEFTTCLVNLIESNDVAFTNAVTYLINNNQNAFATCIVDLITNNNAEFTTCLVNLIESNDVAFTNAITYLIDHNQSAFATPIANVINNNTTAFTDAFNNLYKDYHIKHCILQDDFIGGSIGALGWSLAMGGSFTVDYQNPPLNRPGVLFISGTTGATTDYAEIYIPKCLHRDSVYKVKFCLKVGGASNVGTREFGLYMEGLTEFVRFVASDGSDIWYASCQVQGSSEVKYNTGKTVDTNWHVFDINLEYSGSDKIAKFYIDGQYITSLTYNPTDTAAQRVKIRLGLPAYKTQVLYIDYFLMDIILDRS